jgi:endonuclease/exonuclease/phosphatase family metal-dependent hydrolase
VTWIRFLDQRTDEQFYVVNTHLEAFDATARANSADLILERMQRFDPNLPVVMTGDFNESAVVGGTVYDKLVTNGPLVDTWEKAGERSELYATFHGYRPLVPNGVRIDWILTTPEVETRVAAINTYSKDGQFPSDHLPVQAVVELPDGD